MFMGVTAHHNVPRVSSYAAAQQVLEAAQLTPTGRQRSPKRNGYPLGGHSKSVTWVRMDDDKSIAFCLYDTDVVTWHPDDSFDVDNYGTVTTSGFASRFLPRGIRLSHPVTSRSGDGGHRGICYVTNRDDRGGSWRICVGDLVRFHPHGDVWLPDENTCTAMRFPEIDRRAARGVTKRFHLKPFESWLSMAPQHMRIEHDGWDVDECADALEVRDFRRAAETMPVLKIGDGFGIRDRLRPLPIVTRSWQEAVTMTCLAKLRLALYEREGALETITVETIDSDEFDRRMARVRELRTYTNRGWAMGPQR